MVDYCEPIHASAFSYEGVGCMLIGDSGTGKSRLMAEAILQGAHLIADDQVRLCNLNNHLVASPVPHLAGVMELRGLGLIKGMIKRADAIHSYPIHLVVELDVAADTRLPDINTREYLGIKVPFLCLLPAPMTSVASLLLYLKAMQEGRILPPDWHPSA